MTTQAYQGETSRSSWENDSALIAALLARTPGASRSFIARHDAFFRKVVLSASPAAWVVVDDLTQDVYVHLWRDDFRVLRQWQREHPLRAYLHTVVTRLVWDRLSRLQPAWEHLADDPWMIPGARLGQLDPPPTPEQEVTANELAQIVRDALDGLSANHRQVIELRYIGELSYRETALVLGITPNNAGVRITRALVHLKEMLSQLIDAKDCFSIGRAAVPVVPQAVV